MFSKYPDEYAFKEKSQTWARWATILFIKQIANGLILFRVRKRPNNIKIEIVAAKKNQ